MLTFLQPKAGKLALLQTDKNCNFLTRIFYYIVNLKISNANCLDEMAIHVDTILHLSLYYLVNNLVHLPNSIHINTLETWSEERNSSLGSS